MKSKLIVTALVAILLVGVIAPAFPARVQAAVPSAPVAMTVHAPPAILDKTRFLAHVGAAYFAFHHFVWARYRNHLLDLHHKANLVKAGIALLFAYHELKVAYNIAIKSNSKVLHALVSPLSAFMDKAQSVGSELKSGNFNPSSLQDLNNTASSLHTQASSNGLSIKDVPVTVPGA